MAWVTPTDFVAAQVVTEIDLDVLSDDLSHLKGASGSLVDIEDEISITVTDAATATPVTTLSLTAESTGASVDGFGPRIRMYLIDAGPSTGLLADIVATRNGADNTGALNLLPTSAGVGKYAIRCEADAAGGLVGINADPATVSLSGASLDVFCRAGGTVIQEWASSSGDIGAQLKLSGTAGLFQLKTGGGTYNIVLESGGTSYFNGATKVGIGTTSPQTSLHISGSVAHSNIRVVVATPDTMATTDHIVVNNVATSTINLPGTRHDGQLFVVKNIAATNLTLAGNGANISGSATRTLSQYEAATVVYSATAGMWLLVGEVGDV